jgi:hypothetical protein
VREVAFETFERIQRSIKTKPELAARKQPCEGFGNLRKVMCIVRKARLLWSATYPGRSTKAGLFFKDQKPFRNRKVLDNVSRALPKGRYYTCDGSARSVLHG